MLSVSKLLAPSDPRRSGAEAQRYSREARPVVVWNLTRTCSLHCVHCYNDSEGKAYPGELSTEQAIKVIDDLASFGVPAIIFSGGDPLLRNDIYLLMSYSRDKGVRPILSSNGVTIDCEAARNIKNAGVAYVGVSVDGGQEVNDRLRGMQGGFKKALDGIRYCRDLGLITGIRFTMSRKTIGELPAIFDLLEDEDIPRGYLAHLVYSGRGEKFSREDLGKDETRAAVDYIFKRSNDFIKRGLKKDIVTGSNDADGVYLYLKLKKEDPEKAGRVYRMLLARGGNSSGVMLGNIDNLGEVHADQFWPHHSFGNVLKKPFSEIWTGKNDGLLNALRDRKGRIKGRCSRCRYFDICGGSYRVRAEFATGDLWAEDPACYLTDEEMGL